MLKAAAQGSWLSAEDRAKIAAGATELEVRVGAVRISLSPDQKRVALALANRTIQIVDLAAGSALTMKGGQRGNAGELDFSRNGSLLAAVETGDYRVMNVYEASTGDRLLSASLAGEVSPRLRHLNNGQGFRHHR